MLTTEEGSVSPTEHSVPYQDHLTTVTSLPSSQVSTGLPSTPSSSKTRCSSRGGRSRSTKSRVNGNSRSQQHQPQIDNLIELSRGATGSQSDPTLSLSCHQESRSSRSGRPMADSSLSSSRQAAVSAAEKVMDAYIEKFSVVGYTSSGGCVGVTDSLMPLRVDANRRPGSLQEAICMYIDYLTYENELRTRISECAVSCPPPPLDFHREEYYRDVMCRPVNFPTARFREWLKLYNVDIEITDPEGQTVSQTTFTPYDPPCIQSTPSLHLPWQLGTSIQRRRIQRVRDEMDTQPTWISDVSGQQMSYLQQSYNLPRSPSSSSYCSIGPCDVMTSQVQGHCANDAVTTTATFMRYNPEHQQYIGHTLNDLDGSAMFAYGVMLKDEDQIDLPTDNMAALPGIGVMMRSEEQNYMINDESRYCDNTTGQQHNSDNPTALGLADGYDILRNLESSTTIKSSQNTTECRMLITPASMTTSNSDMMPDTLPGKDQGFLSESADSGAVQWTDVTQTTARYSESAAAVSSLGFDDVSTNISFCESVSRRCWPEPIQWPPSTSFNAGFDDNSLLGSEEPRIKSAKLD